MELSYTELRCKEIVNLLSGAKMGKLVDVIFAADGSGVLGIVAPGQRKLFKPQEDIFIPWKNIKKIGSDVILVEIVLSEVTSVVRGKNPDGSVCDKGCGDFLR